MSHDRTPPARSDARSARPDDVERFHGLVLSDFQRRAITAIRSGANVLVGAPTGAGKTLVAEYAIEDAVRLGRRAIYTAPIKALSNQKYRDFKAAGIDVGLLTGDVTLDPRAQVLVMTTEILRNAIFEGSRDLDDVEYTIFDEIHFLDDPERGAVWEESLIFAPPRMRFICLSATVPNIAELGEWIGEIRERDLVVVESHRRPVPLTHWIWQPGRGLTTFEALDKARRSHHAKGHKSRVRERFVDPDLDALFDELCARGDLPVLCFAFSRKDCEKLARRNGGRDLLTREEHERMRALQEELARLFQLEPDALSRPYLAMARRGLGYHHAGMLPIEKELVERMFTSGLIKMLFTTETFAVGINMPARAVVFNSLKKFDGTSVDWLTTREYLQMAGRAGRQGIDTEGLVVSAIVPRDLPDAPLARLSQGLAEPVQSHFGLSYSSLLHLVSRLSRERVAEAWEKSFHRFQLRDLSAKRQDKDRKRVHRGVEARLAFLDALGYLRGDELTPRGKTARAINGYEVQLTELAWSGLLENLPPQALVMIFTAQVYEDRRPRGGTFVPAKWFGPLRREIDRTMGALAAKESSFGIPDALKAPDWGLTGAALAWCDGRSFDELSEFAEASPGDICRTFRMALQLLRQLKHAIDPAWDLGEQLAQAMALLNRDEVDARAQLELG
ncbi:MAG: DEAD/DEAH box helicase [Planctomycetes bacterium]|nr:DEAD/DEAH box helicase [Planctomycetota bacterium]